MKRKRKRLLLQAGPLVLPFSMAATSEAASFEGYGQNR
jgi:hypothetical protein